MRNGGRLSLILIGFFLATQFLCILGTMCVFASPENIGNYEDISPEHVVPLDPFLAGGASGHALFRSSNNTAPVLKMFGLLPYFVFQFASLAMIALTIPRCAERFQQIRYSLDLWLLNRVLLI